MASEQEKLAQFIGITGANDVTARFFLGAARNDVDAAVNAFFEADGMIPAGAQNPTPAARPAATGPRTLPPSASASGAGPSEGGAPSTSRRGAGSSQFATLGSLRGDEEDEDESGKNYYAGGEKSGQMIQDPRDQNNPANDRRLAEAILERARQRGNERQDDEDRERFSENQRFTGAGYRLGDTGAPPPSAPTTVGRRNVTRTITFYDNGFVVDEGPLRAYEDPANAAFLADVNRGVVPREMEAPGVGDVSITLLDKKGQVYDPPKPRVVPFSGGGQRLTDAAPAPQVAPGPTNADAANATLVVDESQPVAVIQVRLSDGTRLRARLNEDHTVGQLRAFVQAARPAVQSFALATTFPRKELSDDKQTVKEAGLKGAVVVQTLK